MKKLKENVESYKKIYLNFNYTILFFAIYIISYPIVSKIIGIFFPFLSKCIYKELTGRPCPLCGGTRYIANLKNVFSDPSIILKPFGIIMLFVFFNLIFRIWCIYYIKKDGKNIKNIIIADFIMLLTVVIVFFTYEILFIINQYS